MKRIRENAPANMEAIPLSFCHLRRGTTEAGVEEREMEREEESNEEGGGEREGRRRSKEGFLRPHSKWRPFNS